MAQEKFKQACKIFLLRHVPPPVKKMVFTLCILPCIRYPAGLAPWTLQQYRDLEKIPYQLLKQIYGLRLTFSAIHLGGLAKATANALIARDSIIPRKSTNLTCYTDSLQQWAAQFGLTLHQHVASPVPPTSKGFGIF
jgi:hypothetical protein